MATKVDELLLRNKNRAKRDFSSAGFMLQSKLPGSIALKPGAHTLGHIEPNVAIVRVALVVRKGFGAGTQVTVTDSLGNTLFSSANISAETVVESDLTKNAITRPNPIYSKGLYELIANLPNAGTDGKLMVVVEYAQLDTVIGKYTR